MELPDERGTYILIASVLQMKRLKIGRLGTYDLLPGFYAYVGSAFGPGGLRGADTSSLGISGRTALAHRLPAWLC